MKIDMGRLVALLMAVMAGMPGLAADAGSEIVLDFLGPEVEEHREEGGCSHGDPELRRHYVRYLAGEEGINDFPYALRLQNFFECDGYVPDGVFDVLLAAEAAGYPLVCRMLRFYGATEAAPAREPQSAAEPPPETGAVARLLDAAPQYFPEWWDRDGWSKRELDELREHIRQREGEERPYADDYPYMAKTLILCARAPEEDVLAALREMQAGGASCNHSLYDLTPLMKAAIDCRLKICRWLLDHGAEVNAVRERGDTALHLAAMHGNEPCVEMLLAAGADVNMKDRNGRTPLGSALYPPQSKEGPLRKPNAAVVRRLLDAGSPVLGAEILKHVIRMGDEEIERLLLQHGEDVMEKDRHGKTVLEEGEK